MGKATGLILWVVLAVHASAGGAGLPVFEYPSALLDAYDADGGCWMGMDAAGSFPASVRPETWLIGPPLSLDSGVTLSMDHWIDLAFSGRIADGDGNDIVLTETGRAGERALLFVTDGAEQEYLLSEAAIDNSGVQNLTYIGADLAGIALPFVPRAVRLVALDFGGQSPGFDLGSIRARVSHDGSGKPCCPNPVDGAARVDPYTTLTWTPADPAAGQVVCFGEIAAEVSAAAPCVRHVLRPPDANRFEPPALGLGRTYFWRVGETAAADANLVRTGDLWSFTVADRLGIDDFETYDVQQHSVYATWLTRGWARAALERQIVKSCRQSLSIHYHYDASWFSEVLRVFDPPQDWARPQAQVLEIMLRGADGNSADGGLLYVTLGDGAAEQTVVYAGDLGILADPHWHPWRTALVDFNEIDLSHVVSLAIGLCPAAAGAQNRGVGTIYLDDILLRPALCLAGGEATEGGEGLRPADLTADCAVDYRDLQRLTQDWLRERRQVFTVAAPNEPVLWYDFEGDARDHAGGPEGLVLGRCNFVPGVYGQAIDFSSPGDSVVVPEAANVFFRTQEAITIAFWQRGDDSGHRNDTICCSNYIYGEASPALAIHLGCWRDPGRYRWDCGFPWSFENRVAGRHRTQSEWAGRWNHWAFTKRVARPSSVGASASSPPRTGTPPGRMEIYLNGELYDCREGTDTPIAGITSFEIGDGWYGRYDGALDDFRIYDYALSPAEIAYVATRGSGILPESPDPPADLNADGTVNLHDLALLAAEWLRSDLWP